MTTRAPILLLLGASSLWCLDPHKTLTQYSRRIWTQQQDLPQDTVRALTQTADGYLWIGTDDGLARFDGYEPLTFDKANGDLPSNSVTALAATADGALWIGTPEGLTVYRNRRFQTFTTRDGLPDNNIVALFADPRGPLWITAGVALSRLENGRFSNFVPGAGFPLTSVRAVALDRHNQLWVAGFSGVGRLDGGKFTLVVDARTLGDQPVSGLLADPEDNLWIAGSQSVLVRSADGRIRRYDQRDGIPDFPVRGLLRDRDGNLWAATNGGLARFENGRFVTARLEADREHDSIRCLFEDREGDLWVGQSTGLSRYRDDVFSVRGKSEGLPSDSPNAVFQDRSGRIWVGYHDAGLLLIEGGQSRLFTTADGLPSNEVFSIRQTGDGDLLVAGRRGLARMHDLRFSAFVPPDPLARIGVFDALEDGAGRIWLGTLRGLSELRAGSLHNVIPGEPNLVAAVVTMCQGSGGVLWAGTYGKGLWRLEGTERRLFTTADGLSSDSIHSLYQDPDGTLWIATFAGGLNAFRNGRFTHFMQKDGLLSDNLAGMADDGESLWLATTRGICRIAKQQLRDFSDGRRNTLEPVNYGVDDGLRSAQCAPGFPVGGGGTRMADGALWFPTSRGLAVYEPRSRLRKVMPPVVHLVEMSVDGRELDLNGNVQLPAESDHLKFRYTAIHLSAPERVEYSYHLVGLEPDWVRAGSRREINYNSLRHGEYRFIVRAKIPGGPSSEQSFAFVLLPHFYETSWFRGLVALSLLAAGWAVYQMRLRQIRYRFALVLGERARLAREIHDTLAQGFVGISSQLDAVAMTMPDEETPSRKYLDMARRMARHSLTEARRAVMDLRASMLDDQALSAALESGTRLWTAGSPVKVSVEVTGPQTPLPEEVEQHLLRIAQEAVTNTLKHANASTILIKLHTEARKLYLRIVDNGRGFEQQDAFNSVGGHFGLIGMRERAERLGGELRLESHSGEGTRVEVEVPLP